MSWMRFMDAYFGGPPKPPKAKLHVQWSNNVGMLTYVSLNPLPGAEEKIPHMMRSMEGVIALAAKRGAMHE